MSKRLEGKVVIVTGAAQGIGFGCARMAAAEGAQVVLGDIQKERGEEAATTIRREGGQAIFQYADLADESKCSSLVDAAIKNFGRLNGLVNNAGWFPRAHLEETTTELWDKVLNINLRSAFYMSKLATPHLRKANGGSIVNIGSVCGIQGLPNLVAYAAAKGGMLSMTRTLAGALAKDRIRVNYIIPGWIATEGELAIQKGEGRNAADLDREGKKLPLGRMQTVQDAAYATIYLLSDESTQVTGAVLNVDAGGSVLPIQAGTYPG
ncbi:MAG TPA: SDR family NAD(P)-dependent oxidoreductase [Candidatus Dormibacteraeota bacterium]|jgi:NAD(P)-dependent dehydrogenase (short-subunit alcohol dehydrogenase family)|nr:SDR family NAD(P)-dependent oxidoreductase [Candidatus Dormibacteraeota bacterium]